MDLSGWSLDRTADIPKNARFTFGQRIDNLTLSALQMAVRALRIKSPEQKREAVNELDLQLEELRVLWQLVRTRQWISQSQLVHVQGMLPIPVSIGFMATQAGQVLGRAAGRPARAEAGGR